MAFSINWASIQASLHPIQQKNYSGRRQTDIHPMPMTLDGCRSDVKRSRSAIWDEYYLRPLLWISIHVQVSLHPRQQKNYSGRRQTDIHLMPMAQDGCRSDVTEESVNSSVHPWTELYYCPLKYVQRSVDMNQLDFAWVIFEKEYVV